MQLIFPFKNITVNNLLRFAEKRSVISDFILTRQEKYPYSQNYFLDDVAIYKDSLADFENEILQTINTTNQATIDAYFNELFYNATRIQDSISLSEIQKRIKDWNKRSLKEFDKQIIIESEEFFKSENRKKRHLEEYESWNFNPIAGIIGLNNGVQQVKKINYNYYCVEKQPDLIDEIYSDGFRRFLQDLAKIFFEIVNKYGLMYSKGHISSKADKNLFNKPVVFVEGEHDITYIRKAAELLNKKEIIDSIELRQRGGHSNLDKIWHVYKDNNWETIPQKKLLLYDCDVKNQDEETGIVFKRVIPTIPTNLISKGIENLFPNSIIKKAIRANPALIDITKVYRTKRGQSSEEIQYIANEDEKKNLCTWICENTDADAFLNFQVIFELFNLVL